MRRIGEWISSNPKIVETIREIESRSKPIIIESRDDNREIALTTIIKQLVQILSANKNRL